MHDNAQHYTELGPVVDRLYTGFNTANQPSETDQSVPGSDHHYFQIERIEMTSTTKTEMSTVTKWKEKDQACPTTNTHYTELHTIKMIQSISRIYESMNLNR